MKVKQCVIKQILFTILILMDFLTNAAPYWIGTGIGKITILIAIVLPTMKGDFFNIYQIFLFMMFFFNLSIPFFNLFGLYEYPNGYTVLADTGVTLPIKESIMVESFVVIEIFLLGTSIGWMIWNDNINRDKSSILKDKERAQSKDVIFKKVFWQLFKFLWPFEMLYQIIQVYLANKFGYVEVIHLHSVTNSALSVLEYVDYVFPIIGTSILFFTNDRKDYIKKSILYVIPYTILLLTGQRGTGISTILAILFIYSYLYKKINIKKVLLCGLVILFVIIGIGNFRWSRNIQDLIGVNRSLFDSMINEFVLNSESFMVIPYTISLMDKFTNKVPFLFGYIDAIFSFSSNYSIDGILNKSYLAQHITYLLNSSKLLRGSTIGTCILAEIYEFVHGNLFLILIISILLLYFAGVFLRNINRNILFFYFGFSYIQQLFMSPRGSIMKIFNKLSIVYILFYFVLCFIRNKKNKL